MTPNVRDHLTVRQHTLYVPFNYRALMVPHEDAVRTVFESGAIETGRLGSHVGVGTFGGRRQ